MVTHSNSLLFTLLSTDVIYLLTSFLCLKGRRLTCTLTNTHVHTLTYTRTRLPYTYSESRIGLRTHTRVHAHTTPIYIFVVTYWSLFIKLIKEVVFFNIDNSMYGLLEIRSYSVASVGTQVCRAQRLRLPLYSPQDTLPYEQRYHSENRCRVSCGLRTSTGH